MGGGFAGTVISRRGAEFFWLWLCWIWEGWPLCRLVPLRERLTWLTAHRESWIFIIFLNCLRSTRRSTLPTESP